VAISYYGETTYSTDNGRTWAAWEYLLCLEPEGWVVYGWHGVAYRNGTFIAIAGGFDDHSAYSTDGIT
jgi:hypothetical protein